MYTKAIRKIFANPDFIGGLDATHAAAKRVGFHAFAFNGDIYLVSLHDDPPKTPFTLEDFTDAQE